MVLDKATGVISGAPSVLVPTCTITVLNDSGQKLCELVLSALCGPAMSVRTPFKLHSTQSAHHICCWGALFFEGQLHIQPLGLQYQYLKPNGAKPGIDLTVHPILICDETLASLHPTIEEGNFLKYHWQVQPPLPLGKFMDQSNGVITGRSHQPTKKEVFKISATNRTGSTQSLFRISFATSYSCQRKVPSSWSVDHVQLWAKEIVSLDDT